MHRLVLIVALLLPSLAFGQQMRSGYGTADNGAAITVTIGCPGTGVQQYQVVPCTFSGGGSGTTNLTQVGGTTINLGQSTMAASLPVVLASDQSAIPVTGTFFQATQPVSAAALPLPSGAATSALQIAGNTSLASLVTLQNPITPAVSAVNSSSLLVKASAGTLYGAYATASAAGMLVAINATAAPASGATLAPIECVPVGAGQVGFVGYNGGPGESFSTGIVLLYTTGGCGTYTPSATAFLHSLAR